MSAPSFGAAGTYLSGANGTSAAVAVPAGVASGHIVLVHLYLETTAAVTPQAGFTEVTNSPISTSSPGAHTHRVYWKRATGSDTGTYTFSWTGSTWREGSAQRYIDCIAAGDPIDASNAAQRSSNATATPAVSLTTTGADRLIVWSGTNFNGGAWTPPSGYTERVDGTSDLGAATLAQASAGSTGSITGSCASSGFSTAFLLALKPVESATPSGPIYPVSQYGSFH